MQKQLAFKCYPSPVVAAKMHVHQPGVFERKFFLYEKGTAGAGCDFYPWGVSQDLRLTEWVEVGIFLFGRSTSFWST